MISGASLGTKLREDGWLPPDSTWTDMRQALEARAAHAPERMAFEFLDHHGCVVSSLTYGGLLAQARAVAGMLRQYLAAGSPALLVYPPGLDFVVAFFGCLYAAVVPAPVAFSLLPDGVEKLAAVQRAAAAESVLAKAAHLPRLRAAFPRAAALPRHWLATDIVAAGEPDGAYATPRVMRDDIVLLQFSSGSTAEPKGVVIRQKNLLHNLQILNRTFQAGAGDRAVSWLPHHHDMGLIAGILHSVYAGVPTTLMSPMSFLMRPRNWLAAISSRHATLSAAPNFAYEYCASNILEAERIGLDLGSWAVAVSGSEMVRPSTLSRFTEGFAPFGFDERAFFAAYGLAEATLMVSGGMRGMGARVTSFDSQALANNRAIEQDDSKGARVQRIVSCGYPHGILVIADPTSLIPCADGVVGEICISSPSVARAYHRAPVESEAAFGVHLHGRPEAFLRTGDLGFLMHGELYVVGRLKDVVIVRGRNLHPQDIEKTVQACHTAFDGGACAAFGIEADEEERLAIVQEVDGPPSNAAALFDAICKSVRLRHETEVYAVDLVRRGQVPKTSSGKVRRQLCKSRHLAGSLIVFAAWKAL